MAKIVGTRQRVDRTYPIHFELHSGSTPSYWRRMEPCETFVVFVFEGTLLEGDPGALAHVRLHVDVNGNPDLFTISAHQITPHDSVLESRVRRLESVLDGILEMSDAADAKRVQREDRVDRMARVLRKLGYQPHETVDHRRVAKPILVPGGGELSIRLTCGKTPLLDPPAKWLLSVRGIESRDLI